MSKLIDRYSNWEILRDDSKTNYILRDINSRTERIDKQGKLRVSYTRETYYGQILGAVKALASNIADDKCEDLKSWLKEYKLTLNMLTDVFERD